ncbi:MULTISPECIES: hypothetical protein [Kitasatospora]|uniref:Uncharacterized protein n=1 Tax=Kitasatospora setae (strain ATCC 33774 / DSM 43861 / JCM 3304 / KCC A-0304 / NBRC 14216 / KM-6054) TaxID=452652 RepID=E4N210_KITSK|nr:MULTISPECIES: hypothetical protein [Kitasatospora]BAJ32194.1 hypothetical protein KSE_64350 [Kitasatospora setae KM-6054]
MARKPPGAVRALLAVPRRALHRPVRPLRGLPARTVAAVRRFEAARLWPGAVADALHAYEGFLRQPGQYLYVPLSDCPCCDPLEARDTLELALRLLPRPAGAPLRAAVDRLDTEFRRRTLPDPRAAPAGAWHAAAWWRRRLTGS